MTKGKLWLAVICLIIFSLVLVSCDKTTSSTGTPAPAKTTATYTTTVVATGNTNASPTANSSTSATTTVPQYGGILRVGDWRFSNFLGNPARDNQGYAQRQAMPAIETLLRIDAKGEVIPWLAQSWVEDPAASTITLILNKGITFHDGTPFNAAAVKWNLDQDVAAKQTGYANIKSVDAVNDTIVRINLLSWDNTLLDMLGYSYIGMMISPTTAQKMGTDWINNNCVGTGPFLFETWIKQVTISFTKNKNYWQAGKPYLDHIENVLIADQTVGMLNFEKGNTDMFLEPATSDLPDLLKKYPGTTVLPFSAISTVRAGAIFDSADPKSPFADLRVRQAFNYAINANEMNQALLSGNGQVSNQFVSPDSWGYNPDIVGYPYNPTKAKQLLSEAGYAPGELKTNYTYQIGAEDEQSALAIQGYCKAVGIDLTLIPTTSIGLIQAYTKWDGLCKTGAIPSPDVAAGYRDRYTGIDPRYYTEMLVPPDYLQAVSIAVVASDFATKQKWVREAGRLFTDKYCLAVSWCSPAQACVNQSWVHDHGMYKAASLSQWTPETAWKEPGH